MRNERIRTLGAVIGTAVVIIALFAAVTSGWMNAPAVEAQGVPANSGVERMITTVGEGSVRIKPDIAYATIGVDVLRDTVQEASAENKALLESVLTALKDLGVAESDLQTTGFSIYAERYGPSGPLPEEDVNYRVTNNVRVTIRDLDQIGELLDAAVEAGANNIYGVEFSLEDRDALESGARELAVADALAKAEELALLNGLEVGPVLSISELIGSGGGYFGGNFSQQNMGLGGGGGGAPISPGELELVMQLQITFGIAE